MKDVVSRGSDKIRSEILMFQVKRRKHEIIF